MTTHQPRGFFARLRALIRGTFGVWVRDRERENPQAVYEQAIQERTRQYRELKQAVAGILYMRNKIQADLAGIPVVRTKVAEATALGAAYMAGLAVDVWADLSTLEERWSVDRRRQNAVCAEARVHQQKLAEAC